MNEINIFKEYKDIDFHKDHIIQLINLSLEATEYNQVKINLIFCDNDNLIVDQRCHETLSSLDQYQWDPNPNLLKEKPKHNMASHMADALRYALYSFETSVTSF